MTEKWIDEANEAIRDSSPESSVYIGCDSIRFKKNGQWFAKYSTVIIIHKDSKHGCTLYHNEQTLPDYGNLRQRLMTEVGFAVDVGLKVIDSVGDRHCEIHLDLNPSEKHKSSVAVKEAIGYVRGSFVNVEPKIKPASFAATSCADHLVRR